MRVKIKEGEEHSEPKAKIITCGKDGKLKVWDFTRYVVQKFILHNNIQFFLIRTYDKEFFF